MANVRSRVPVARPEKVTATEPSVTAAPPSNVQNLSRIHLEAGQVYLLAGAAAPNEAAPAPPKVLAASGQAKGQIILMAQKDIPQSFFILGDRFAPIPALAGGKAAAVSLADEQPLEKLRQDVAQPGLSDDGLLLFKRWDQAYRHTDTPYLVWTAAQEGRTCLMTVEVRMGAAGRD